MSELRSAGAAAGAVPDDAAAVLADGAVYDSLVADAGAVLVREPDGYGALLMSERDRILEDMNQPTWKQFFDRLLAAIAIVLGRRS